MKDSNSRRGVLRMKTIDLRSDTVTQPTPAMREAIARAEVGDDVFGEDPTVNRLEGLAAERMGKEAALLVVSGTMGNLCALLAHCSRGQAALVGVESHIYNYEAGGASALGGIIYRPLRTLSDGTLEHNLVEEVLDTLNSQHVTTPGVLCLENTHNRCGGAVLQPSYMAAVYSLTQKSGIPLHLDGARVFNAAVALNLDVKALTQYTDTIQFCLSKGLSAPVGSVLAGPQVIIDRARRIRKMLGGGMRQAGVIAAAGIVALNQMVERLTEDHKTARLLAEGLVALPGIDLDLSRVQSNIVIFDLVGEESAGTMLTPHQFVAALREQGVLMRSIGGARVRAVTHYGITADDVKTAVAAVKQVVRD
jgi:threonine aldolase